MSIATGVDGNVAFSSGDYSSWADTNAHIYEWSMTQSNDEYDSTVFASSHGEGKTVEFGLWQATGSLRAFMDKVAVMDVSSTGLNAPLATASTLTLTFNSGNTHAFPAHLFNIKVSVDRQSGLNILDCDFESTGDLVITRPLS